MPGTAIKFYYKEKSFLIIDSLTIICIIDNTNNYWIWSLFLNKFSCFLSYKILMENLWNKQNLYEKILSKLLKFINFETVTCFQLKKIFKIILTFRVYYGNWVKKCIQLLIRNFNLFYFFTCLYFFSFFFTFIQYLSRIWIYKHFFNKLIYFLLYKIDVPVNEQYE